jgi:uncharacterized membrane protein
MLGTLSNTVSYTTVGWDHDHMNMGVIPMIIFWALLIALFVWIFRAAQRADDARETPTQILDRRFAEGSITAEEFEHRRSLIASAPPPKPVASGARSPTTPSPGGH